MISEIIQFLHSKRLKIHFVIGRIEMLQIIIFNKCKSNALVLTPPEESLPETFLRKKVSRWWW